MKKSICLFTFVFFCYLIAFGSNGNGNRGYKADVTLTGSLGTSVDLMPFLVSLETGHGYCFGNNWYAGGGTGIELFEDIYYYVPVYSEIRYYIPGTVLYLNGKIGAEFSSGYGLQQPFLLSEGGLGVTNGKWSVSLCLRYLSLSMGTISPASIANLRFGIGYHF